MAGRLEGKVAIITGGSSGMGRDTVDLFLKEGARVVCGDVQDKRGETMTNELGNNFSYFHCDVSKEEDVKNLVDHALAKFGKLDVMFNNAGIGGANGRLHELKMDEVDRTYEVDLKGVIMGYKYAIPPMLKQRSGSIISTASGGGLQGGLGPIVYATMKAAVIHYARCAALHLSKDFIRSNTICPGTIATPVFSEGMNLDPVSADIFAQSMEKNLSGFQPMPRAGKGIDIANAALFLASDESTFVTGHALVVDGGLNAGTTEGLGKRVDFNKVWADFDAAGGKRPAKKS